MTVAIQRKKSQNGIKIILIALAGVSSMLFIVGPLSIVPYAVFAKYAIIPSVIAIFAIGIFLRIKSPHIANRLFGGMAAGFIATLGLETIRVPGYMFTKWIPMDSMISLPGLLLTEKIFSLSEIKQVIMQSGVPMNLYHAPLDAFMAGALWHFWNGATFGIVYALIVGRGKWWYGLIFGVIIEIAMMLAPYLIVMKGPFGIEHMDGYNMFVFTLIAHLIFGAVLGVLVRKFVKNSNKNDEKKIEDNPNADIKSE